MIWGNVRRRPKVAHVVMCVLTLALVMDDAAAEQAAHHETGSPGAWAEQLKGQTIVEDVMEGRPERTAMVDRQHHRIMEQMQADAEAQRTGGFYNNLTMMH